MERGFKRAWCILLSFVVVSFSIDLREAENLALKNFSELKIERLESEKKTQERLESFGRFLPTLNLEASFNLAKKQSFTFPLSPPQEITFQKGSYTKFNLQAVQELFNLKNFREYEIARKAESLQELLVAERENEVLYRLREAYINSLKAKAVVEIYKEHEELVQAHLRDVQELYKEGVVAFKDILETKVRLYEVKEKLAKAEADYVKSLQYLSYLTGVEVKEVKPIEDREKPDLTELSRQELFEALLENRPILKYMKGNLELSESYVELARSSFYPVAVLEAVYQRTEESDIFPKDRYLISFAFRWNLFSGFRRFRALELSELTKRQTYERYRDTEQRLALELDGVLEDIKAVKAKIELARQQLEDAKEHLRIAQEKFKAGLGTNTEVLDAQNYLITAENTLRINEYELLLQRFRLLRVVGYER
ncbi:outer membrane protein TolC [Hydrogenivirga caldilitoris]|uniref:Outer membrane protein TolC n=1 Tax=Hydrogenivirga caldilitoris TaxID=246264 RepID=A0A497XVN7_9AQUI|nr:TolC family protein [Hydrogenivirga caldilitoris]RLJ71222.1 outer membrane protein TolC [Hydrogenivirga caldilitoris]